MRVSGVVFADRIVRDAGRSDALDQAFQAVAETDLGAGRKFGPRTIETLIGIVSARAHGMPLYELSHLVRLADLIGGREGWVGVFFGISVARASAFRGMFEDRIRRLDRSIVSGPNARIALTESGATLLYEDKPFTVTYGRMPFLAALMELLVTLIGYRAVDDAYRATLEAPFRIDAGTESSRAMSRALYAVLKEHLHSVQSDRTFRALARALARRHGGGGFTIDDAGDGFVLDFWVGAASEDELAAEDGGLGVVHAETDSASEDPASGASASGDSASGDPDRDDDGAADVVRTFRRVAEQVAHFRTAFEAGLARRSMSRAASIGADREAGEVDPDMILSAMESFEAADDPLRILIEAQDGRLKILNRRETERMESIRALGAQARHLPLTVLRMEVFSPVQARIVQAVRDRMDPAALAGLIQCDGASDYAARLEEWSLLVAHLDRMAKAALAILIEGRRPAAVMAVADMVPAFDPGKLRAALIEATGVEGRDDNVIALHAAKDPRAALSNLVDMLADERAVGPEVTAAIREARAALRGLSRQGFAHADRSKPEVLDALEAAASPVRSLARDLTGVRAVVERSLSTAGDDAFAVDRAIFADRFAELYQSYGMGETHVDVG
jgi:hypothetical protein